MRDRLKIYITNKKNGTGVGHYVGRPSVLGNPFVLKHEGEREKVIQQFAEYFRTAIKQEAVRKEMNELWRKLVREGTLTLVCWCSPKRCHAEVIAQALAKAAHERGMSVEIIYK